METNQITQEVPSQNKLWNFFKDYFSMIRSPSKTIDRLNSREPNLLKALLVVLISSAIFLGGIFIYGDPVLFYYDFYSSNFILEQATSFTSFTYFTYTTHMGIIFIKHLLFWIKIWVILGLLIYVLSRVLKIEKITLERTLEMTAWSMFPWLAISIIFIPIMMLFNLIIPAYAYVIYFPVVVGIIAIIAPCLFSAFIYKKYKISSFKSTFPYIFSLLILYAVWMYSNTELWFHLLIL